MSSVWVSFDNCFGAGKYDEWLISLRMADNALSSSTYWFKQVYSSDYWIVSG